MKRVPETVLEFDTNFVRDLIFPENNNRRQLDLSLKALHEVIEHDLTERQKQFIQLYFFENLNTRQIAELLGLNPSTVSRTLTRAKKRIYKVLHVYIDFLRTEKLD